MVVEYNDIFYRMIEAFIDLQMPNNLLVDEAETEFDPDLLDEYKNMRREDLDYFKASMILLDSNYFTDEAFLYFFPMILKQIFDNDGLLKPLIARLEKLDKEELTYEQNEVVTDMVEALKIIEKNTANSNSEEIITFL